MTSIYNIIQWKRSCSKSIWLKYNRKILWRITLYFTNL